MNICAIILSAGKSKRFKSSKPKFLHEISGKALIQFNIDALKKIKQVKKTFIVSSKANKQYFNNNIFIQNPIDGTGGALKQFYKHNKKFDFYLLTLADTPIFDYKILSKFLSKGVKSNIDLSVLTQNVENPKGYGRIIRENKSFIKITEENDCSRDEKSINEINTGIFLISKKALRNLELIKKNKIKNEFYITDLVNICVNKNLKISAFLNEANEISGANTLKELNQLEIQSQNFIKKNLLDSGVRIIHPETVYIESNVNISPGVVIEPNVVIKKNVNIKSETIIKSFSYIENSSIGRNCSIGPYARIRPEADIADNVKIGNFVEIKKSKLSKGVKVNHLSYIGDTTVGLNSNIGAGTITCNYDGKNKLKCKIGDNTFIGSNTTIIAPVKIGSKAYIAAGSVITKTIPSNHFSIARSKQKNKININK